MFVIFRLYIFIFFFLFPKAKIEIAWDNLFADGEKTDY